MNDKGFVAEKRYARREAALNWWNGLTEHERLTYSKSLKIKCDYRMLTGSDIEKLFKIWSL